MKCNRKERLNCLQEVEDTNSHCFLDFRFPHLSSHISFNSSAKNLVCLNLSSHFSIVPPFSWILASFSLLSTILSLCLSQVFVFLCGVSIEAFVCINRCWKCCFALTSCSSYVMVIHIYTRDACSFIIVFLCKYYSSYFFTSCAWIFFSAKSPLLWLTSHWFLFIYVKSLPQPYSTLTGRIIILSYLLRYHPCHVTLLPSVSFPSFITALFICSATPTATLTICLFSKSIHFFIPVPSYSGLKAH